MISDRAEIGGAPLTLLELLFVSITAFTAVMFYLEENFMASILALGVLFVIAWTVLDRSVL